MSSHLTWGGNPGAPELISVLLRQNWERPLAEADFLGVGNKNLLNWEGRCIAWNAELLPARTSERMSWEFLAQSSTPSQSVRRVFAILNASEKTLAGFGVFDVEGRSRCHLLPGKYIASTGFGEGRMETPFEAEKSAPPQTPVRLRETGRAILVPGPEQGISPGDLVRIGRTPLRDSSILFSDASIAQSLSPDLYMPTASASENLGVSEYLFTTLFVGNSPITLNLDEGSYKFAIFSRQSGKQCLIETQVQKEAPQYLRCETKSHVEPNSFSNHTRLDITHLDPTVMPIWQESGLLAHHHTEFPNLPRSAENEFSLGDIFLPRMLDASSISDANNLCISVINGFENTKRPVAGTGEKQLHAGATPFFIATTSPFESSSPEKMIDGYYALSNGADIEFSGGSNETLWPPLSQQRLRAILRIPMGNNSTQFSIFVNGKEFRRVSLNRGNTHENARLVIDETISKREDFQLATCTWGRTPLPEFLTGARDSLPLLITRPVCIDADGDGRCTIQE
jgi:hypothetical protein